MKVIKFGGTSVGSANSILSVKRIVEAINEPLIVVVSALGGITDKLINTSKMAASGDASYENEFREIVYRHVEMIKEVIPAGESQVALQRQVGELLNELKDIFQGIYLIKDLSQKTSDTIVSYGERLSSIIAAQLTGAEWFDSRRFIKTEKKHSKHVLDTELTTALVRETFKDMPKRVLVPGFISTDKTTGEVTNLGRGGSDTSAVALAAALNADMCEIYTDVEGVYTADPRVVPDAVKLDEISYDEMLELASLGAKVLHSRSVEVAKKYNVKLVVRSSMSEAEGTEVKEDVKMERMLVSGVAADKKVSRISIMGINDEPGKAFEVFSLMAKEKVSVDIILQSTGADGKQNISFTIGEDDLDIALKALEKNKERLTAREIVHDENTAKLSIVGAGMATNPGVAAMFFEAMYDAGVNIQMISTSEIKITVLIAKDDVDAAMVAVHDKFKMASVNMRKAADTEE